MSVLNRLFTAIYCIFSPETTIVKFSEAPLQQGSEAQCIAHQTADVKFEGSILCRIFLVTPRCLPVQYSVYLMIINNGLYLNGLSCLFLLQIYRPMLKVIGSNPAKGSRLGT